MKNVSASSMKGVLLGGIVCLLLVGQVAKADFIFGEPTLFDEPVNSAGIEYFSCISADGLEIYIEKPIGGITSLNWDIYVSTRETPNDLWSVPVSLGPTVNSSGLDYSACLSSNGLELYFSSDRPGGYGRTDLWFSTRPMRLDPWGPPENLGSPINTSRKDITPWITPDGLELYFSSDRPGGYGVYDFWVATRTTANDEWEEPVNLGPVVNSTAGEYHPCLSPDGLVLFFSDYDNPSFGFRPGGHGRSDMWMTRRKSTADPWESPVNLGPDMNTRAFDSQPRLSPDGSVLYFTSSRPDSWALFQNSIWQAPIHPVVDFTGDFQVDIEDLILLIARWGQNEPEYDMGPMPWGDGVVDAADLEVLMSHWGEDANFIAHWTLDEAGGDVAYDSAADNDAVVMGAALWQPEGGQIDGALQFDGVTSYLSAPFIIDPPRQPFSAYAWIKGGQPGQTIISQQGALSEWLSLDAAGTLTCTLTWPLPSVTSTVVLTDDLWHHIGLVSDGSGISLYVDNVEVATSDTSPILRAIGDLQIGVGKNLESGTFWSGLIDDVRIYDRVVTPQDL